MTDTRHLRGTMVFVLKNWITWFDATVVWITTDTDAEMVLLRCMPATCRRNINMKSEISKSVWESTEKQVETMDYLWRGNWRDRSSVCLAMHISCLDDLTLVRRIYSVTTKAFTSNRQLALQSVSRSSSSLIRLTIYIHLWATCERSSYQSLVICLFCL